MDSASNYQLPDLVKVIDYVQGFDEFDSSLWYFDGRYVGHDDQIEVTDFTDQIGGQVLLLWRHRRFLDGLDYLADIEPHLGGDALIDIEHLLQPLPRKES